jgi:hypothetical protein
MGWHEPGVVHLCAWERDLWWDRTYPAFVREHQDILDRLGVDRGRDARRRPSCSEVERSTGGAFQFLHVLLHELGHHHDRMPTRSQPRSAPRGEPFAEAYARTFQERLWDTYLADSVAT